MTKATQEQKILELDPASVKKDWRVRGDGSYGDIQGLADSIQKEGQLQPIAVRYSKKVKGYVIIAGLRRTRACKLLGRPVLAMEVKPNDELHTLDMQLAENLLRKDFEVLEVANGLKRRKELYEKAHPETKHGASGGGKKGKGTKRKTEVSESDTSVHRFTLATATQFGVGETKIKEMLQISELPEDEQEAIAEKESAKDRNKAAREALSKQRKQRKKEKLEAKAQEKEEKRQGKEQEEPEEKPEKGKKSKKAKGKKETPKKSKKARKKEAPEVSIIHGAWEDSLEEIEEGTIDLVLTDPPYGLERNPIGHDEREPINGEDPDWDTLDVSWLEAIMPLLDDDGQVLTFCAVEDIGLFQEAFEQEGLTYRGFLIWYKSNPAPAHRSTYVDSCEAVVWGTKGDKYHFTPFDNAGKAEAHNHRTGPICAGDERSEHPTQKPLWLIEDLLLRHTASVGRVLDPFAGSGTTLVACKKQGRYGIGCEREEDYVEIADLRLKATDPEDA